MCGSDPNARDKEMTTKVCIICGMYTCKHMDKEVDMGITHTTPESELCPDCREILIRAEACQLCPMCGFSRC